MRRLIALLLGGSAVALSVGLTTYAATCGARAISGNPNSACASAFGTFHVVYTALALVGALGAWFGARWVPASIGGFLAVWGVMNAVGTGIYALPVGLVLITCAAVMPPSNAAKKVAPVPAGADAGSSASQSTGPAQ